MFSPSGPKLWFDNSVSFHGALEYTLTLTRNHYPKPPPELLGILLWPPLGSWLEVFPFFLATGVFLPWFMWPFFAAAGA